MHDWKKRIETVRALSPALSEILAVIQEDDPASLQKLVAAIESDPVLSAGILKLANSASFGFSREIMDIRRAVNLIGFAAVIEMALALTLSPIFNGTNQYLVDQLWRHSITTACIARELCSYSLEQVIPGMAYTVGLLHDIGKAVLIDEYAARSREIQLMLHRSEGDDFIPAEHEVLGISHVSAGALLLNSWKLPQMIKDAIHWHHEPTLCDDTARPAADIVHIADHLAMWCGCGTEFDSGCYETDEDAFSRVNISSPRLERLLQNALVGSDGMIRGLTGAAGN